MFTEEVERSRAWEGYSRDWERVMDYLGITSGVCQGQAIRKAVHCRVREEWLQGELATWSYDGHVSRRKTMVEEGGKPTNPCCHRALQCREWSHLQACG